MSKTDYTVDIGQQFGFWKVIAYVPGAYNPNAALCICACSRLKTVTLRSLLRGESRSCGCRPGYATEEAYQAALAQKERAGKRMHGQSGTRLYKIWLELRRLDRNKRKRIVLFPYWQDFNVFKQWADANGYADTHHLVRKLHYRGHSPENCEWKL